MAITLKKTRTIQENMQRKQRWYNVKKQHPANELNYKLKDKSGVGIIVDYSRDDTAVNGV